MRYVFYVASGISTLKQFDSADESLRWIGQFTFDNLGNSDSWIDLVFDGEIASRSSSVTFEDVSKLIEPPQSDSQDPLPDDLICESCGHYKREHSYFYKNFEEKQKFGCDLCPCEPLSEIPVLAECNNCGHQKSNHGFYSGKCTLICRCTSFEKEPNNTVEGSIST